MRHPSRDLDQLAARRALCTIADLSLVLSDLAAR
jgi:hypothetical protein